MIVAAVLSGNRNFEGRIHPQVRANYLASPPLVVAYALAGRMDVDLTTEPLGKDARGNPSTCATSGPRTPTSMRPSPNRVSEAMFRARYADVFAGDERWRALDVPAGERYAWDPKSEYVKRPPYFDGMPATPGEPRDISGARALAVLGDSVTTDHISPAGNIAKNGPGREISDGARHRVCRLQLVRRAARQSRSDGARHVRQRAAAQRNSCRAWKGGVTRYLPEGEQMSIFDAVGALQGRRHAADRARRQRVRFGFVARLGREGSDAARRPRRHRGIVRAHPPLEPDRHGHLAARVLAGQNRASLGLTGEEIFDIENVAAHLAAQPAQRARDRCG
jgi:aconitate hydratase